MSDKDANRVRDRLPPVPPASYQVSPSGSAPRQVASSCPPASAATATATAVAPRPSGKNNVVASASAAAFCLHEMRHETKKQKEQDDDYGDTL